MQERITDSVSAFKARVCAIPERFVRILVDKENYLKAEFYLLFIRSQLASDKNPFFSNIQRGGSEKLSLNRCKSISARLLRFLLYINISVY